MLYIFFGPDSFQRREAIGEVKAALDTDGMLETNTVALSARETTLEEVIAACDTVPFLAEHRLVILEGALRGVPASGGRRSRKALAPAASGDAGQWQGLVEYVDRMPASTVLVLVDDWAQEKSDLLSALAAKGTAREFARLRQKDLAGWVQRRARKLEVRIDGRASALLAQLAGGQTGESDRDKRPYIDTWALANELDKLAAYAGGQVIREEDVRALVSAAREQQGYLLADAVAERRGAAAVNLLHELIDRGEHPLSLLGTIQTRYRRLVIAREMLDAGASESSVGARLGQKGYGLARLVEQASRHPMTELRAAYARLVEADADIKRGVYSEEESLELLVHDLTSGSVRAT